MIRGAIGHTPAAMGIEIQFLGAVGTVTGSQFLVSAGDRSVLVDCGMFQGSPEEVSRNRIPVRLRGGHARRAAADPRAPRPLRPHTGPGQGGLPRTDLRHGGHRRPGRDRPARRRQAAGGGRGALAPQAPRAGGCARRRPGRARRRPSRTTPRCRSACARPSREGMTMTRAALYDERDVEQTVRQFRAVALRTR